jgi:hypothetical protein
LGIGQAVTFFEKTLKKVAISPNPINTALGSKWIVSDGIKKGKKTKVSS